MPTQMALRTRPLPTKALECFWLLQIVPLTNAYLLLEIRHLISLASFKKSYKLLICTKTFSLRSRQMDLSSFVIQEPPSKQFQRETLSSLIKSTSFCGILKNWTKLNCFLKWLPVHVSIEGNEKADKLTKKARNNNNSKNKNTTLIDPNAIADFKLREKLYPTKNQICKINADRLINKTIVKLRMGLHREIRIDREGKKHHRKCDNCSETELTQDHIFNSPAIILSLLEISVWPTTIDLYENKLS